MICLNIYTAKSGSTALQALTSAQRARVLDRLAELVLEREKEILKENSLDLSHASHLAPPLFSRLKLSREKLESLASGLRQLAVSVRESNHVKRTIRRTRVGNGLVLTQQKVPIGVLLVIFESRPDCLIQVRPHLIHSEAFKALFNYPSPFSGGPGNEASEVCCDLEQPTHTLKRLVNFTHA